MPLVVEVGDVIYLVRLITYLPPLAAQAGVLVMLLVQQVPQISLIVLLVAQNMVTLEAAVGPTKVEEEGVLVL